MMISKIAIFSVGQLRFGVEASQVQEIVTIPPQRIVRTLDQRCAVASIQPPQALLPIFDIAAYLCAPQPPAANGNPPRSLLCVTFRWQQFLLACRVSSVENVLPVTCAALQPVPRVIAPFAAHSHIWGFYQRQDTFIPLLDLERYFPPRDLQEYLRVIFPAA